MLDVVLGFNSKRIFSVGQECINNPNSGPGEIQAAKVMRHAERPQ